MNLEMAIYDKDLVAMQLRKLLDEIGEHRLTVKDLLNIDQMHYRGVQCLDHMVGRLHLRKDEKVLDIGGGYGGSARYLADSYGLNVTSLEIQKHIHLLAKQMTEKVGLQDRVHHECYDFLEVDVHSRFDKAYSLLVFLHIIEKEKIFPGLWHVLKPGGEFYIEDYYQKFDLTDGEILDLEEHVACRRLLSLDAYIKMAEDAGFDDIQFEDLSDDWADYTRERFEKYAATSREQADLLGTEQVKRQLRFYEVISQLFEAGRVGGLRISGRKKLPD